MAVKLKAVQREDLSGSNTKKLRQGGFIPAVVYGKDVDNQSIAVNQLELLKTIRDEGRNAIISLELDNDSEVNVMVQDYQMHPINNNILHVDFYAVDLTEEIDVEVSVRLEGEAAGVREGGIVQQPLYELQVRAKPHEIPEEIVVDISALEIGDSITVEDLPKAETYEVLDDGESPVVVILPPETEEELEEEEADLSVEPELVGAEDEEDEEEA